MNNFCVHYQTWKNEKALQHTLASFRKFFPNNKIRVVSDCGNDYSHLTQTYNFDFEFCTINTMPSGRFRNIDSCYEWLSRVFDTCIMYDTEWVVLFEDDVVTQSSKITFPKEDSGGFISWPWTTQLTEHLISRNNKNKVWGYGMSGGSIFRRDCFIESYMRLNDFDLNKISTLDGRIITHTDTLMNCFLQYFGFSYEVWNGITDMTYPGVDVSKDACFVHGYKELY